MGGPFLFFGFFIFWVQNFQKTPKLAISNLVNALNARVFELGVSNFIYSLPYTVSKKGPFLFFGFFIFWVQNHQKTRKLAIFNLVNALNARVFELGASNFIYSLPYTVSKSALTFSSVPVISCQNFEKKNFEKNRKIGIRIHALLLEGASTGGLSSVVFHF